MSRLQIRVMSQQYSYGYGGGYGAGYGYGQSTPTAAAPTYSAQNYGGVRMPYPGQASSFSQGYQRPAAPMTGATQTPSLHQPSGKGELTCVYWPLS